MIVCQASRLPSYLTHAANLESSAACFCLDRKYWNPGLDHMCVPAVYPIPRTTVFLTMQRLISCDHNGCPRLGGALRNISQVRHRKCAVAQRHEYRNRTQTESDRRLYDIYCLHGTNYAVQNCHLAILPPNREPTGMVSLVGQRRHHRCGRFRHCYTLQLTFSLSTVGKILGPQSCNRARPLHRPGRHVSGHGRPRRRNRHCDYFHPHSYGS